jgi:polar amino acid transport system substrate-binding protein
LIIERIAVAAVLALALLPGRGSAAALQVLTEENAPFNFTEGGALKGIGVDLLDAAMREAGRTFDPAAIQVVPWARAYESVRATPDTMLFSMARTAEREPLFAWVGPILKVQIGVLALRERRIAIASPAELASYKIATVRDGAPEQLLLAAGVPESALDRGPGIEANLRKLLAGRVDMVAFNVPGALHTLYRMGNDPAMCSVVHVLKENSLHYAFNKTTDPALLKELQAALDRIRARGEHDAIVRRYVW